MIKNAKIRHSLEYSACQANETIFNPGPDWSGTEAAQKLHQVAAQGKELQSRESFQGEVAR